MSMTLSESLSSTSQVSDINYHIKCLLSWTTLNYTKINYSKTKEMLLGPLSKLSISPMVINYNSTERDCGCKLLGICTLTIFAPERMLICITSNNFSVLVFLLTNLLFGIPPSLDQFLKTAQLFGTTAWGNIRQKRLRRSRGELFTSSIQWQRLCHTGWHCSMLSFRLFQIGVTNSAMIFFPQTAQSIQLHLSSVATHSWLSNHLSA